MEINQKVGLWTLITPVSCGQRWKCICDCGTVRSVLTYNLKERKTKSCGCTRDAIKHAASAPTNNTWAAYNARKREAAHVSL